ncbi:TM2 domain-containing protein [Salinibacter altiplanensis]|uniref:TM2 domain-containing protein n=1 Tax=Salinibacter altiplanensis TaxID=1803181 RepID=UPI000C9EEDB4|nr:TM2 domain-containing protein [Salinibacter altiplanensis]
MSKVLRHLPELDGDEQVEVARLLNDMSDAQAGHFARIYRSRRREPVHILLLAAIGFVGAGGLHRLYLEEFALGLVYLFTGGLCVIGTIYDVIKYKDLALRYNRDVALETAETVRQVYDGASESGDV